MRSNLQRSYHPKTAVAQVEAYSKDSTLPLQPTVWLLPSDQPRFAAGLAGLGWSIFATFVEESLQLLLAGTFSAYAPTPTDPLGLKHLAKTLQMTITCFVERFALTSPEVCRGFDYVRFLP